MTNISASENCIAITFIIVLNKGEIEEGMKDEQSW